AAPIPAARARGARAGSLGRRILRTETAGLAALTLCMMRLELAETEG
ncbi:MAG: 16S rRNA methyltransferase, partial [Lachnospiraceae bacterium]|nr:16S rRNA methyltransferase [Lachnospiraceae bacterium]